MNSTLALSNVTKVFNQAGQACSVFKDLSIEFQQGVSYAITGVSGSGKSTLLSLLCGFEKPTAGTVFFGKKNIDSILAEQYRDFFHQSVSIVFQSAHLVPELSVLENVILKGLCSGMSFTACIGKGHELLERVGLGHKAHALPMTLSEGEQQRVSIIRALFLDSVFLLADEPTAKLDAANKQLVIDLLFEYKKRLSMGLIISSHDPSVADRMDVRFSLDNGRLLQC